VFADLEGLGDAGDLQHGADAGARLGRARVAAEDADGAAGGGGEAEHQPHRSRFTRAVRAKERDDFAGMER
jgi:hypothetical protein